MDMGLEFQAIPISGVTEYEQKGNFYVLFKCGQRVQILYNVVRNIDTKINFDSAL